MLLHSVIVCSYYICLSLVLEDVVACAQCRQVDFSGVSHVVVRISSLDLVEDGERLLELVFNELMLHLQCIVQLNLWVSLFDTLNLIHRQRRCIIQVQCRHRLLLFHPTTLNMWQRRCLSAESASHHTIAAKGLLLKLARVCLLSAIKTAHHGLVCLTDYFFGVADFGVALSHAWITS